MWPRERRLILLWTTIPLLMGLVGCAAQGGRIPIGADPSTGIEVDQKSCEMHARIEAAEARRSGTEVAEGSVGSALFAGFRPELAVPTMGASILLAPFILVPLAVVAEADAASERRGKVAYTAFMDACLEPVLRQQTLGPEDPAVAQSLHRLAFRFDRSGGQYRDAAHKLQEAIASQVMVATPSRGFRDSCTISQGCDTTELTRRQTLNYNMTRYTTLAEIYMGKADSLYKRALAIREKVLGPENLDVAETLDDYAALLRKMNRGAEADGLNARAQAIRTKAQHKEQRDDEN